MNTREQLREWALRLAERGWYVFPLMPGAKRPALHGDNSRNPCPRTGPCANGHLGWEQRAITDPAVITTCWKTGEWNIGLATGPSGLVVIDLDVPKPGATPPEGWNRVGVSRGEDVLTVLAERAGAEVPVTYTVHTPSGGLHLYFRAPAGQALRNTAGSLGWCVDTRAHGGYVVAPGSVTTAGIYEPLGDHEPVELPTWLHQALTVRPPTAISAANDKPVTHPSAYVQAALRGSAERVQKAPSGAHNKTVFGAAAALGELVAGGQLDYATASSVLQQAAAGIVTSGCDCTASEIAATIHSGLRYGGRRPRSLDGTRRAA